MKDVETVDLTLKFITVTAAYNKTENKMGKENTRVLGGRTDKK